MTNLADKGPLARKIIAERERRRWTQADLADRAGVSRSWVAAIESGTQKTPRIGFLRRVALVLELDLASLVTDELDDVFGSAASAAEIGRKLDRILDNEEALLDGMQELLANVLIIVEGMNDGQATEETRRALREALGAVNESDGLDRERHRP